MSFRLVPNVPASPPLPSGEHPWAARLRLLKKSLSLAELALAIAITYVLFNGPAEEWAISTQVRFQSPWVRALAFSALLSLVYALPTLPFTAMRFVLDKKFGLSTQTLPGWLLDLVKGALLGAALGSIVVLGLTATLVYGKHHWWWQAAIGATLFGVLLTRLAPQLIIPLFFKMKPVENAELVERFTSLARSTGTPVLGIFEINLSTRTNAANAAVVGFGGSRRAVVGDTLLTKFETDEVEFVLAHELAHHRYHDLWSGMALGSLLTFAGLYFTHLVLDDPGASRLFDTQPAGFDPIVLFLIAVLTTVMGWGLNPFSRLLSRFVETRADTFAAAQTRHAGAGARAFRKLGGQNLAVFRPPAWEEFLFYTHPCIARRIERLEANATPEN